MIRNDSAVVKTSISLSGPVAGWADDLAAKKGFGTNFSAYIADLIRRDKERDDALQLAGITSADKKAGVSSPKKRRAADAIVSVVEQAARKKILSARKK